MPIADGRFKGISVPAEVWERLFGRAKSKVFSSVLDCVASDGPRGKISHPTQKAENPEGDH